MAILEPWEDDKFFNPFVLVVAALVIVALALVAIILLATSNMQF